MQGNDELSKMLHDFIDATINKLTEENDPLRVQPDHTVAVDRIRARDISEEEAHQLGADYSRGPIGMIRFDGFSRQNNDDCVYPTATITLFNMEGMAALHSTINSYVDRLTPEQREQYDKFLREHEQDDDEAPEPVPAEAGRCESECPSPNLDHIPDDGPGFAAFFEERTTQAAAHAARCQNNECELCGNEEAR
jgi:hypothetical protein